MFTTDTPVDLRFMIWAGPIVQDIQRRRRIEWIDRTGTLRGYSDDGGDDIRQAIVRVTLTSGWELEVPFIDLMTAAQRGGYRRR